MVDEIIAKSILLKTLKEHTEEVIKAWNELREKAKNLGINLGENDWIILKKACFFHDFGKANTAFQYRIRKQKPETVQIPHNFLSLAFLEDSEEILLKLIAFHHWRNLTKVKKNELEEVYSDIKNYIPKLNEYFNESFGIIPLGHFKKRLELLDKCFSKRVDQRIDLKDEKEKKFIILLGFLNRIDHSASAGVPMEINPIDKFTKTKEFLFSKSSTPWQLSEIKEDFKEKNGIVVASTGMGKTEMALLWSDKEKTFYTLPVRTSVTAMYERFTKPELFGKENVGLLHSDALSHLLFSEDKFETDDAFHHYDMAKNLSYPLIVSTADQIFPATLKYLGFEKIYATLSYSKIVIDEIQAYSPQTMAIIIHGLKEISLLGGKFLIVTATLPSFIENMLQYDFSITKIPNLKKHKIELMKNKFEKTSIKSLIEKLQNKGIKKILIVCNTVEKAQELYSSLKQFSPLLLHSRFTRVDRKNKENMVLEKNYEGILIATQIIEVSLDIDFDVLITEMAPLDVLIQRMGRVYRRFKTDGEFYPHEPNIYIFTEEVSGIETVYEFEIVRNSINLLNNGVLSEEEKFQMVKEFYSEKSLKNTQYLTKFNNALEAIGYYTVNRKTEAQEIFREIYQVEVIPEKLLDSEVQNDTILKGLKLERGPFKDIIEKVKITNKKDKIYVMELVKDFLVPIPFYKLKNTQSIPMSEYVGNKELKELLGNIMVIDYKYDKNLGILWEKERDNFLID